MKRSSIILSHPISDPVAKRAVRLVPPFGKGGLGGISERHAQENPPRPPFRKGGRLLCNSTIALIVFLLSLPLCVAAQETKRETKKPIRFGLQVAQQQTTVAELKEVWQEAEALGFDTLWTQ